MPDGSATSVRIALVTSRTVQAIQIPRNKLKESAERKEAQSVGVYFLFGDNSEENIKPLCYIGEAENCWERLIQHNREKDFWKTAVVITSRTANFTKAHGKFLEWFCYSKAKDANRFRLEQTVPSKPYLSESDEADLLDNVETIKVLLSTLGFPILESISKPTLEKNSDKQNLLYCKRKEFFAEGEYIDDGFVVFKGGKVRVIESESAGNWLVNLRKQLIAEGILILQGDYLTFTQNYVFDSPSAAAAVVVGSQANGWTEWKNKDGITLDELKRR